MCGLHYGLCWFLLYEKDGVVETVFFTFVEKVRSQERCCFFRCHLFSMQGVCDCFWEGEGQRKGQGNGLDDSYRHNETRSQALIDVVFE